MVIAPPPNAPLVVATNVSKSFRIKGTGWAGRKAVVRSVDDVSLEVRDGEILGLVGESGSGKSTLARLFLKLVEVDHGEISIDGIDVRRVHGRHRVRDLRKAAQLVFQDPHASMDPRRTIGQSLTAVLSQNKIGAEAERAEAVRRALSDVGLDESYIGRFPSECSGGQLQRVVIARALLLGPRLLICDEPTSALDASVQAKVLNLLMRLRREQEITMLFISHDLRVVASIADRIAVMYAGRIVEVGNVEQVMDRPFHQYTQNLIRSSLLEQFFDEAKALDPAEAAESWRFQAGCPHGPGGCPQGCSPRQPELVELSDDPGHWVRCWLPPGEPAAGA